MPAWIYVFFGGGIGSVARWATSKYVVTLDGGFPKATFIANILACLILGLLMGYHFKHPMAHQYKLLLMMGFCGGFSTFSTFSAEIFLLLKSGNLWMAFSYIFASMIAGLIAVFIGLKLYS